MKKKLTISIIYSFFFSLAYGQLPIDEDGWTIIEPSTDSKVIYVSSSTGDDSNDGLSPETAIASISKAKSLSRKNYPDHILFKTGDEWTTAYGFGLFIQAEVHRNQP